MNRLDWCQSFIRLRGAPISFGERLYLAPIYNSTARRIVLRASRQVEKTTFLCNVVIHAAVTLPGVHIVVVFPRHEQSAVFVKSRLRPMISESPIPRRILLGRPGRDPQVNHMRFKNGSEVYIRSAFHNADAARGIDADYLLIDEYQDVCSGNLPVLEESLSHSEHRKVFLTGTPKDIGNHLEDAFDRSTAHEWRVPCQCGERVFLDERCLSVGGPVCPKCDSPIDPRRGLWIPRNPDSVWGDGFTLNHLLVPWCNYPELFEHYTSYDPALFRNECMGLPVCIGDHMVSREQVEACCTDQPMASSLSDVPHAVRRLFAGVDWGGRGADGVSRTVLVIGAMVDDDIFRVYFMERYLSQEDPDTVAEMVAKRCRAFGIRYIAADGAGVGSVYNALLLNMLPQVKLLLGMFYTVADGQPQRYKGRYWNWSVGRTPSIGMIFTRVKKDRITFPRLEDSSSFLEEIWCETAELDRHKRAIKFTRPATQSDDTLHAINYAAIIARRALDDRYAHGL